MKIALTGGRGFIGQNLLKNSSEKDFFVVAASEIAPCSVRGKNISYCLSDYSEDSFADIFDGCDAVIHCGAKRGEEKNDSISDYFSNITTSENLLKACVRLNIKNIVNISSRSVYSKDIPSPQKENVISPINNYAISKLCVEHLCDLYNRNFDMNIKTLRLSQVLGLGERSCYLLTAYLENCLAKKPLSVYGKGVQSRDYIYVKDVCNSIMQALSHADKKGVFNLGSGVSTSVADIAKLFCEVFENPHEPVFLTDKPDIEEFSFLDMTKARNELNINIQYSFKEALIDMKKELENASEIF